jgi:hypothetical protein
MTSIIHGPHTEYVFFPHFDLDYAKWISDKLMLSIMFVFGDPSLIIIPRNADCVLVCANWCTTIVIWRRETDSHIGLPSIISVIQAVIVHP